MTRPGIEPATSRSQSGRSTTEPLCRYVRWKLSISDRSADKLQAWSFKLPTFSLTNFWPNCVNRFFVRGNPNDRCYYQPKNVRKPRHFGPKRSYQHYVAVMLVNLVDYSWNQSKLRKRISVHSVPVHWHCIYRQSLFVWDRRHIDW